MSYLPALNIACNFAAFLVLLAGLVALKRGHIALHRRLMVAATALLLLFLVGYITKVTVIGVERYQGEHRSLYLTILMIHMTIAVPTLLYFIPRTLYYAYTNRIGEHRLLARITAGAWIASTLTSMPVYTLLYGWPF